MASIGNGRSRYVISPLSLASLCYVPVFLLAFPLSVLFLSFGDVHVIPDSVRMYLCALILEVRRRLTTARFFCGEVFMSVKHRLSEQRCSSISTFFSMYPIKRWVFWQSECILLYVRLFPSRRYVCVETVGGTSVNF